MTHPPKTPPTPQTEESDLLERLIELKDSNGDFVIRDVSNSPKFSAMVNFILQDRKRAVLEARVDELYQANVDRNDPETFYARLAKLTPKKGTQE